MKTKSRIGKTDSIFAKTTTAPVRESSTPDKRPPAGLSVDNKLTVILPPDQVAFLDRLCLDIRAKTKIKIRRTEVIRALIAGVRASKLDLTAYGDEQDLADAIAGRLKGTQPR